MVDDPLHRLDAQPALPTDIGHGAVDQPFQHVLLEGSGVGPVRFVPGAALGAGRSPRAVRAPVPFRVNLDQHRPAKHRQVAQADRPVNPVNPVKLPAAVMTLGCPQRTFHFDQQGGIRQFPAGQHPHIGQIQGQTNRDRHRQQSKRGEEPPQLFILGLLMPSQDIVVFTGNLIEPREANKTAVNLRMVFSFFGWSGV